MSVGLKRRIMTTVCTITLSLGLGGTAVAQSLVASPTDGCDSNILRGEIAADNEAGLSLQEIQEKYAHCIAGEAVSQPEALDSFLAGPIPSNIITNTGSVFWEAIRTCGYHPQREEVACTVDIKRRTGYIGIPANSVPFGGTGFVGPGSFEHGLFCVDFGTGLVPVNSNVFHVHDEPYGIRPDWAQALVIQSNGRLASIINRGQTMRGRVILSWFFPPIGCFSTPIFGNQADIRFKLDP